MGFLRIATALFARICLSAMFLASGINKIFYWKEVEKRLLAVLGEWQTHTVALESAQAVFNAAVVWLPILLMVGTFLEILGALLLLFGIQEKLGAFLLAIILIPTTILLQSFWFSEGLEQEQQLAAFLKNMAILGGLLVVILHREPEYEYENRQIRQVPIE
ncbi:MAG TPA: DoxX family membrane protein [Chlamydiales bacterium]|nr:DoxX family membrane protein [Chlamydiales bacterium]